MVCGSDPGSGSRRCRFGRAGLVLWVSVVPVGAVRVSVVFVLVVVAGFDAAAAVVGVEVGVD